LGLFDKTNFTSSYLVPKNLQVLCIVIYKWNLQVS
jgi:hypothetical protein